MSQRTSSIPQVLDALEDGFTSALATADPDGGPVPVQQGEFKKPPQQYVEISDVQGVAQQTWAALGAKTRDENYAIAVFIYVNDQARYKTQRDAKNRAFEILAILESTLRTDVTVGLEQNAGFTFLEVQIQTIGTRGEPTESGFDYTIAWAIKVHSRI